MRFVKRTYYITMTKRQAAAAFEEYLAERPPALEKLRAELAADGLDADALLDGTPQSLAPLWRWVASRITAVEDEDVPWDPEAPPSPGGRRGPAIPRTSFTAPRWRSWPCSTGSSPTSATSSPPVHPKRCGRSATTG
ncbi:hypothetical protein KTU01_29360 [Kocuria turfanensis]|uniref:Uncharacterized protein n=1 Tax=Kocuria turfanensis TaxID=388357 RepID=A0A512IGI4_9MICC|nr:hypothetical protein KTU01_29360 [Kocuria turfanensis]